MKCIDKYLKLFGCTILSISMLTGCSASGMSAAAYENGNYKKTPYRAEGFADTLCVASEDVVLEAVNTDASLNAAGLFSIDDEKVLYSYNIHKKLYPASVTKILTALVALKYGNLEDTVTVSKKATTFPFGASLCNIREGDRISLKDLLYGLFLPSGNDAAAAIAEHISGSEEEFVKLMNSEAQRIGATNTHFTNPHGLHDDNHYTTAYDLYLIFNECLKHDTFVKIIETPSYTATVTGGNGSSRKLEWKTTHLYASGEAKKPEKLTMIGGKTGNTDEAKRCLIFYSKDQQNKAYISIVMGAASKPALYEDMNNMLNVLPIS